MDNESADNKNLENSNAPERYDLIDRGKLRKSLKETNLAAASFLTLTSAVGGCDIANNLFSTPDCSVPDKKYETTIPNDAHHGHTGDEKRLAQEVEKHKKGTGISKIFVGTAGAVTAGTAAASIQFLNGIGKAEYKDRVNKIIKRGRRRKQPNGRDEELGDDSLSR